MIHFFKKKKLIVDAFCSEEYIGAFEYSPIDYASKFYPEWWKKIEKPTYDWTKMVMSTNMRHCAGIINEYNNGIIIPMWSDLALSVENTPAVGINWKYQFADRISVIAIHPDKQRGEFKTDCFHFKIISPWLLQSEKNILFQCNVPYYNFNEEMNFTVIPGTVDYFYQNYTNINCFTKPVTSEQQRIFLKSGQPIFHIKPLSDRKIVLKKHLISNSEFKIKMANKRPMNFYKDFYIKKNIAKKCPFEGDR
jgi:hypothetical protein